MRDLSEGVGASASNSSHRLVGFEPFAAAALFLRISSASRGAVFAVQWLGLETEGEF